MSNNLSQETADCLNEANEARMKGEDRNFIMWLERAEQKIEQITRAISALKSEVDAKTAREARSLAWEIYGDIIEATRKKPVVILKSKS